MAAPSPNDANVTSDHVIHDVDTTQQWLPGDDTTETSLADANLAYSLDAQLAALETNNAPPPPDNAELAELQPIVQQLHSLAQLLSTASGVASDEQVTSTFIPKKIGKYEVVRRLGEGGQGSAYLAFDPDLRRHVVVKLYRDAKTAEEQEALLTEGRALARVRSRFVAQVHAAERAEGIPYLVVEYVPGKSLAELLNGRALDLDRALNLAEQLAEGLLAVHACGLLHRDLKPSNVMIGDDGMPRLVDFGLATAFGDESLRRISGTLAYMAPEQARGESERIDPRSDVYGLGAVLYAMLTGRAPHQGNSRDALWKAAKDGDVVPPRTLLPALPVIVDNLIMKALAKDPGQRFGSARELVEALQEVQRRRQWMGNVWQRSRQHPALFALCGVAAAAVLLYVGIEMVAPRMRPDNQLTLAEVTGTPRSPEFRDAKTPQNQLFLEQGSPPNPAPPFPAVPLQMKTEKGVHLHPDGHVLRHDFKVNVEPVGGRMGPNGFLNLIEDEVLTFRVVAERNCYLGVCYVDGDGMVVRLFPNEKETDHFLKAGTPRLIPDPDKATVRATPSTGKEYVYFTASTQHWTPVTGKRVEGSAFATFFSKEEKDRIQGEFKEVRGLNLEFKPQKPAEVSEAVIPFFVEKR